MLTIVATPIGNLKDITIRALEVLQAVDGIVCEDSRRTTQLLNHYQIHKPLLVINDYNEAKVVLTIIQRLLEGQTLALVSDAGTPLISDPGFKLVRACLEQDIPIDSIPGPFAGVTALTLSGLPTDKFLFLGYLPDKPSHRQAVYQQITQISTVLKLTFIVYLAPFKIVKTLQELADHFPNLTITLAKELTKIYQNVQSKPILDWIEQFQKATPKGEHVMLFRLNDSSPKPSRP